MKCAHIKNYLARIVVCVLGAAFVCLPAVTHADLDNKGQSFIVGFTPNYPNYSGYITEVHISADVATNVTVNYPVNNPTFTTTVPVTPGTVTIVSLPTTVQGAWVADVVGNNAVEVVSPEEVVVYLINLAPATSDAALALPVDTLNTEYIVSTYNEAFVAAEFVVVAAFNNTTVTITPSNNAVGGHPAGVPYNVVLNRGEGYLVQGSNVGPNGGLAGSIVTSDKPVSVTNGNSCTQVPLGTTACDTLMEVAQPTQSWGNDALVVNLPQRPSGSIYRIVASQDNTNVTVDGAALGTINRGGYLETAALPNSHVIAGDKPIFVTQYMTGQDFQGASGGDPAMGNMIPTAQYLRNYTFSTVGGNQFAAHYLTIIANNSDVGSLTLDGAAVSSASFSPIPGTNFSSAVLSLTEGTHTTSSVNPHGITVEGYNSYDSYLYPGGALFRFINAAGDANPPLCSVTLNGGTMFSGSGTDNRPSEDVNNNKILDPGEDLNGNGLIDKDTGVFFVELLAGSSNVNLVVDQFVPGAGSVNYTANILVPGSPVSGTIRVTDGAGNVCQSNLSTAADCLGVPGGSAKVDSCGVCNGDGSSCTSCTPLAADAKASKKGGAVLSTAKLLVDRTQLFNMKARECGLSAGSATQSVKRAQSLYGSIKDLVKSNFQASQLVCAETVCSKASTKQTSSSLKKYTQRLYLVQKQAKLRAIEQCHVRAHSGDTRKRTEGYRDDVLSAINGLPSSVTRCS